MRQDLVSAVTDSGFDLRIGVQELAFQFRKSTKRVSTVFGNSRRNSPWRLDFSLHSASARWPEERGRSPVWNARTYSIFHDVDI